MIYFSTKVHSILHKTLKGMQNILHYHIKLHIQAFSVFSCGDLNDTYSDVHINAQEMWIDVFFKNKTKVKYTHTHTHAKANNRMIVLFVLSLFS